MAVSIAAVVVTFLLPWLTSPATVLSRGKTPDLRSVTFDGATAGLRGGGAPAAALELLSRSELTAWHLSLQNETQSFNSLAIYGELRLREALLLETDPDEFYSNAPHRAAKGCEIPNFKGSYLGRFPLVSANSWTSDHLSERSRNVNAVFGTRARGTLTLKRR